MNQPENVIITNKIIDLLCKIHSTERLKRIYRFVTYHYIRDE